MRANKEEQVKELRDLVRSFQPEKFENEDHIADEDHIAIDEELGYFLKSQFEELRDVREAALKFLAERIEKKVENGIEVKIKKKSDKLEEIRKWTQAIDDYCTNHKQRVTDNAYHSVVNDIALLYEHDLYKVKNAKREDIYKNDNERIYFIIEEINLSLYSSQDRGALRQHEERRNTIISSYDERNYPSSDSDHEGRRNTIISSDDERNYPSSDSDHEGRRNTIISSDDERNYPSSDSDHEGRRNTIISSDDEEIRNMSFELSQMDQAIQQSLELSQMDQAIQQSLELSQMDQAIQQAPEQFNPRVNPHRNLEGTATLIRARLRQIFERFRQIVQSYYLEHDHRPQSHEQQTLEQRYELIDVSHMASPQIINLDEVLRQQLQRMWGQMRDLVPRRVS